MQDQLTVPQDHFPEAAIDSPADPVAMLESRLDRGWEVITAAEHRGEPTDQLFNHFLDLLNQYERLFAIQFAPRS